MIYLEKKLTIIHDLLNSNKNEEACIKFFNLIRDLEKINHENLPSLYYEFAFILFNNDFYEDCIIMLNNAYKHDYMKNEIKDFIFNSFITPNSKEFEESYINNINKYISNNITLPTLSYSDLQLEFIPVSENRYYIYDLTKDLFDEFIDFSNQNLESQHSINFNDNFSDFLLLDDYNLNNIAPYINSPKNKKIYYLPSFPLKTLSFFKLPNIIENYLNNVLIFESSNKLQTFFHSNLNVYLPKIIIDLKNNKDHEYNTRTLIEQEHEFRISSSNRDESNILLSICIPTWNRGHRALENIKSLLELNYDSEIEFVISNNGSDKNIDGYNDIKNINDSRISYFEFSSNQGYLINVCNVLDIAKGKFAVLLSDEDTIDSTVLPYFMDILRNNQGLGVIRTGTSQFYSNLEQIHVEAGDSAFLKFFLCNNYVTGIIYNTEILRKDRLTKYILDNSSNLSCYFYAHMWLDAFITFKGDFYQYPAILCIEGSSESTIKNNDANIISTIYDDLITYQHYESRIEQHNGFIDLINRLPINDFKTCIMAYLQLCWKTHFLVSLVKDTYIKHSYDWNRIYDELYSCCIDGIYKLKIELNSELKTLVEDFIKKENQKYRI